MHSGLIWHHLNTSFAFVIACWNRCFTVKVIDSSPKNSTKNIPTLDNFRHVLVLNIWFIQVSISDQKIFYQSKHWVLSHTMLWKDMKKFSFGNLLTLRHLLQWGMEFGFGLLWQAKILGTVQLIEEVETTNSSWVARSSRGSSLRPWGDKLPWIGSVTPFPPPPRLQIRLQSLFYSPFTSTPDNQ